MMLLPPRPTLFPYTTLFRSKEKAYLASMKSDLRNLVTAEEAYFADSVKYTAAYGAGGINFVQSTRSEEHTSELQSLSQLVCSAHLDKTKTCSIDIGSTSTAP